MKKKNREALLTALTEFQVLLGDLKHMYYLCS